MQNASIDFNKSSIVFVCFGARKWELMQRINLLSSYLIIAMTTIGGI